MRKFWVILLVGLMLASGARAEELPAEVQALLPADAAVSEEMELGGIHVLTMEIPATGEVLLLTIDMKTGAALSLTTEVPAGYAADAPLVERERAEEIVRESYPECLVLFAEQTEAGKRLAVMTDALCGGIVIAEEKIISREFSVGAYMKEGRLTMAGALAALSLHRPEAEFRALELDEDDGVLVYEGNATMDGAEYEFELNAHTGKLIEWERD